MEYSIRQLSQMAGVSARTLRYYDEIELLKPLYVNEAGYRFYGEDQVNLLQQILFYRERGFSLQQISKVLYSDDFNVLSALQEHLQELENQRSQTEMLIGIIRNTIASIKGEYIMNDKEKFEAFKKNLIEENDKFYGEEIRVKYGDEEINSSNMKLLKMTEEEYERFKNLGVEINEELKSAVNNKIQVNSEEGKKIVVLHKKWLEMTWNKYTPAAHQGLALMYVADERFKVYYDKEVSGCAEFLEKAVCFWADKI